MRVLILGGTEFVGRAFVEEGVARGWDVSVFNRGTNSVPDGVTGLRGDRRTAEGLAALEVGEWDIVVDTWSWAPAAVRDSVELLAERTGRYIYVSSRSVYEFPTVAGADESSVLVDSEADLDGDEVAYPQAKRGAEIAIERVFGERGLLIRAGLVIGPYENIGRLPWWLGRISLGGVVLAPGPRELGLQYIDARDLAVWSFDAAVAGLGGPYNMISPPAFTSMEELLSACVEVTGADAELRWVEPVAILAAGVEPWTDLPIWIPPGELHTTIHEAGVAKVIAAGLKCRPVLETVRDTWAWLQSIGGTAPQRPDRPALGLDFQVEAAILRGHEG